MSLGLVCLLAAGWGASSDRDSVRLAEMGARLPAEIQAKLQARKAKGIDSVRIKGMSASQTPAQARRNALEERERLLQSLGPEERARMEAALKDMERQHQERLQSIRQRQESPRFRE